MQSDSNMEGIFSSKFDQIFVAADTSSFQGFTGELFPFIWYHMNAQREVIYWGFLFTQIKDSDLWVWYSTTEAGLGIRFVFAVAITEKWVVVNEYDINEQFFES